MLCCSGATFFRLMVTVKGTYTALISTVIKGMQRMDWAMRIKMTNIMQTACQ